MLKINHTFDFAVCIVNFTRARAWITQFVALFIRFWALQVSITAGFYYLKEWIILTHKDTCSEDIGSLSQGSSSTNPDTDLLSVKITCPVSFPFAPGTLMDLLKSKTTAALRDQRYQLTVKLNVSDFGYFKMVICWTSCLPALDKKNLPNNIHCLFFTDVKFILFSFTLLLHLKAVSIFLKLVVCLWKIKINH